MLYDLSRTILADTEREVAELTKGASMEAASSWKNDVNSWRARVLRSIRASQTPAAPDASLEPM